MRKSGLITQALMTALAGAVADTAHAIKISVGGHTFSGTLDDSPVANQIYAMLPFRLSLTELGGAKSMEICLI